MRERELETRLKKLLDVRTTNVASLLNFDNFDDLVLD